MKLPENKEARQKVLALAGIGVAAVGYALWAFVYQPMATERAATRTAIEEAQAELGKAHVLVGTMGKQKDRLRDTTAKLLERSERDMLHPRLGNYLLQAREILDRQARELGVESYQVAEVGLADLPRAPKSKTKRAVRYYAVRVTAQCSLELFAQWIGVLERENPLLSIGQFLIAAQAKTPLVHQVRFEVHWPIWVDFSLQDVVRGDAREILGEAGP
jgi:hypothetical protein